MRTEREDARSRTSPPSTWPEMTPGTASPTARGGALMTATTAAATLMTVVAPFLDGGRATLVVAVLGSVALLLLAQVRRTASAPLNVAVIGSSATTLALAAELAATGAKRYELTGRIGPRPASASDGSWLGSLHDLREVVHRHEIDLLLLSNGVPRMEVFDELARSCADLPVRLCELSAFYEKHFWHIPIAEINLAWFQCVLHPRYSVRPSPAKRLFDIALSVTIGVAFAPFLLLAALLIRCDGGPVLYRQLRVGERGRVFTVVKLRTMRVAPDGGSAWTLAGDSRITPIGAVLRRTHIDELPQLINVLRGDMSIVGPRPEQPGYVSHLERVIPFYSRRHLLRPGLTGWAQIHCGYAGSERGTAWKLSHDLFYVKNRSLGLDVKILLKTVRTTYAKPLFGEPRHLPFVFGVDVPETEALAPLQLP
jgi:exopolysaccharide biosynthesis polyprenyl glycosylphosphotransferase